MNVFYTSELMATFGYNAVYHMTCGITREGLQRMHTLFGMVLMYADMAECNAKEVIRDLETDISVFYGTRHGIQPTEATDPQFCGTLSAAMRWLTRHAAE